MNFLPILHVDQAGLGAQAMTKLHNLKYYYSIYKDDLDIINPEAISRVEVIDQDNEMTLYSNTALGNVELSFEDGGRTLKLFVKTRR